MERWYSIEPIKGYVCKSDFEQIKEILVMSFNKEVQLIKRQRFIIAIIESELYTNTGYMYNLLNNACYSKVYQIKTLTDWKGRLTGKTYTYETRTIGMPY